MAVAVVPLEQTHKLLHDQKGDDPAENPQTHRHVAAVVGSCTGGEQRRSINPRTFLPPEPGSGSVFLGEEGSWRPPWECPWDSSLLCECPWSSPW